MVIAVFADGTMGGYVLSDMEKGDSLGVGGDGLELGQTF